MRREETPVDCVDPLNFRHGIEPIHFELFSAIGGRVLSIRRFNDHRSEYETSLYVISSEENIGDRVSKIINLEMFK